MDENVSPSQEQTIPRGKKIASFYYRYAAFSLDGLIVGFIMFPIAILMFLLGFKENDSLPGIMGAFVGFIYSVILIKNRQATFGKQFFRMKVETVNGEPMTWSRAIKREVLGKIISTIFLNLGYIWAVFDKRKQAWHDKIAGTVVIETEPVSKGRKIVAFILVFGLVILAIMGIVAVIILVSLNPQKQLDKAREMQRTTEERMSNNNQENQQSKSPASEQVARARDAGRISGVLQMGRATQAYYVRNQNYPSLSSWSTDLITSGELGKIPDAIKYGSGNKSCSTNLVNDTWCYNSNTTDTMVFAKLESQQRNSVCTSDQISYVIFSTKLGRGGTVCSKNDPAPSASYKFL